MTIQEMRRRFRRWMLKKAASVVVRCVTTELVQHGYAAETASRIVNREVDAVAKDYLKTFSWEKSEQQIMEARLNRRYDLGSALNEAANRAIAEKAKDSHLARSHSMSGSQAAALEYQKKYLENIVKNGGRRH